MRQEIFAPFRGTARCLCIVTTEFDDPLPDETLREIVREEESKTLYFKEVEPFNHWTFAMRGERTGLWHELDAWEDAACLTIIVWR